jgi:hypothetical protein
MDLDKHIEEVQAQHSIFRDCGDASNFSVENKWEHKSSELGTPDRRRSKHKKRTWHVFPLLRASNG